MAHDPVHMNLDLMESDSPLVRERTKQQLLALLYYLSAHDKFFLESHANTVPMIYDSGIRFDYDASEWSDIPNLIRNHKGNCKDFTAWRVAELRTLGVKCRPFIQWHRGRKDGFWQFHAVVLRDPAPTLQFPPPFAVDPAGNPVLYPSDARDGIIEDPSKVLGMGWNEITENRR